MLRPPERYALYTEYSVPTTYEEAITCPEAAQWTETIKYELGAHRKNETWEIVKRVPGSKTIDSKWVFKILRNTTGNVFKFKARLCARGFMQREGVDYSETISPVVRYDSLRVLLAVITQDDLDMIQFDVRTAFLHGILDEDILMEVLTGLQVSNETGGQEDVVCRLKKSIYGLNQAPRCWNLKFKDFY
jgi:Reverse transcriptase (RNA-dependent DNA polymerase).